MMFDVYKSNRSGEWWAGTVEAADEASAIAQAVQQFPSRNCTDAFRVALRTPERQTELDQAEGEAILRNALVPLTWRQQCANRVQAYKNQCVDRKIAALPKNPDCAAVIEQIAENLEKQKK